MGLSGQTDSTDPAWDSLSPSLSAPLQLACALSQNKKIYLKNFKKRNKHNERNHEATDRLAKGITLRKEEWNLLVTSCLLSIKPVWMLGCIDTE